MASVVARVPSTPPLASSASHQPHQSHAHGQNTSVDQQSVASDLPPLTSPSYYHYYQQTYHNHQETAYHHTSPSDDGSYFHYGGPLISDYSGYHHGFDYDYSRYPLDGGHNVHHHGLVHPPPLTSSSSSASSTSPPRHHTLGPSGYPTWDHLNMGVHGAGLHPMIPNYQPTADYPIHQAASHHETFPAANVPPGNCTSVVANNVTTLLTTLDSSSAPPSALENYTNVPPPEKRAKNQQKAKAAAKIDNKSSTVVSEEGLISVTTTTTNAQGIAMTITTTTTPSGRVVRVVKKRSTANKKERRRTQSINNAFAELRECIPNVPSDTKLSKIKTLRLATSYIAYLMDLIGASDDATSTTTEVGDNIEMELETVKAESTQVTYTGLADQLVPRQCDPPATYVHNNNYKEEGYCFVGNPSRSPSGQQSYLASSPETELNGSSAVFQHENTAHGGYGQQLGHGYSDNFRRGHSNHGSSGDLHIKEESVEGSSPRAFASISDQSILGQQTGLTNQTQSHGSSDENIGPLQSAFSSSDYSSASRHPCLGDPENMVTCASTRRARGRTGWPQQMWAHELKQI